MLSIKIVNLLFDLYKYVRSFEISDMIFVAMSTFLFEKYIVDLIKLLLKPIYPHWYDILISLFLEMSIANVVHKVYLNFDIGNQNSYQKTISASKTILPISISISIRYSNKIFISNSDRSNLKFPLHSWDNQHFPSFRYQNQTVKVRRFTIVEPNWIR